MAPWRRVIGSAVGAVDRAVVAAMQMRGRWDAEERIAQLGPTPHPAASGAASAAANAGVPATQTRRAQDGQIYGAFTSRDEAVWAASTQAFVDKGNHIFHDTAELGGTIGVSCDSATRTRRT